MHQDLLVLLLEIVFRQLHLAQPDIFALEPSNSLVKLDLVSHCYSSPGQKKGVGGLVEDMYQRLKDRLHQLQECFNKGF